MAASIMLIRDRTHTSRDCRGTAQGAGKFVKQLSGTPRRIDSTDLDGLRSTQFSQRMALRNH